MTSPNPIPSFKRRRFLQSLAAIACFSGLRAGALASVPAGGGRFACVRPGDLGWPSEAAWRELDQQVGYGLVSVRSPLEACISAPVHGACEALFKALKNPYFIGDDVSLTQSLGWVDAWTSAPSVYAVVARNASDVVAAVNFARRNALRLVVKGGGHSYQGTSNAPNSLLVWTRRMNDIVLRDAFVADGCQAHAAPVRAVTIGAGALWAHVYDTVTTQGGGYVQGGGCMTVGVAGLIQSGGFGSFSKAYGLAAASLLEAEVVTADGQVRLANACTNPDLFWALKGGGGGSFGIVTRLTLRVHELPETFGAVNITIKARSAAAFRRLVGAMMDFGRQNLINPHWGEQITLRRDNVLDVAMVFQGFGRSRAQAIWRPFMDFVARAPEDFTVRFWPPKIVAASARSYWAPTMLKKLFGFVSSDDRPGAPKANIFWPADRWDAGHVLHGYESAWLPAGLLHDDRRHALADALFAASRQWDITLHFNKGLAGASAEVIAAAGDTAMNPAVLDAFALLICQAAEPPAYPGIRGHECHVAAARRDRQAVARAMAEVRKLVPNAGSYVAESNFFDANWQRSFWGANYHRLLAIKEKYDRDGLFFVHHGVGSEYWSADGFTRLS
ncbi:MAG: FAD-binding oxidoreductase [Paraburkholderia tropica]|uniref:FAD-dependent oxidoreductase n=1 Tax=Burkholderia gladioli TaxID=28095 RepID=UPI000F5343D7|nr:FAD-binding oxidoreductase [Burkholderia gladioli]